MIIKNVIINYSDVVKEWVETTVLACVTIYWYYTNQKNT